MHVFGQREEAVVPEGTDTGREACSILQTLELHEVLQIVFMVMNLMRALIPHCDTFTQATWVLVL